MAWVKHLKLVQKGPGTTSLEQLPCNYFPGPERADHQKGHFTRGSQTELSSLGLSCSVAPWLLELLKGTLRRTEHEANEPMSVRHGHL